MVNISIGIIYKKALDISNIMKDFSIVVFVVLYILIAIAIIVTLSYNIIKKIETWYDKD